MMQARKWLLSATMSLCLASTMAVAGPQEDAELAEKELQKGDLMAATELWRKAAQQGYAPAQVRFAEVLDKAEFDEEAVQWYRKAAEQGYAAGELGLAEMYMKGEGVAKDPAQARLYLLRAAKQNHVPAMVLMVMFHMYGELGFPIDMEQAKMWDDKVYAINGTRRIKPDANAEKKTNAEKKK
jgi:TPR repeat protein